MFMRLPASVIENSSRSLKSKWLMYAVGFTGYCSEVASTASQSVSCNKYASNLPGSTLCCKYCFDICVCKYYHLRCPFMWEVFVVIMILHATHC